MANTIPDPGSAIPIQQLFYGGAGAVTGGVGGVLNTVWGHVLAVVFGILGGLAVLMLFYGGIQYITAGASPDGTKKARQTITNAVTGIIILTAAYAILAVIYGIANFFATNL